jgi:bifunctional DNA-binding transcriptional regulator/antitoxin component of YhaV-PrlF toxin-antitoxin module
MTSTRSRGLGSGRICNNFHTDSMRLNTVVRATLARMTVELSLGTTILSRGRRTTVPKQVLEVLKLTALHQKQKILWTQEGNEVILRKGTLQSSFRKTVLSRDGSAAVPKHVRKALGLESTTRREERIMWIQKGTEILVRKGTPLQGSTEHTSKSSGAQLPRSCIHSYRPTRSRLSSQSAVKHR